MSRVTCPKCSRDITVRPNGSVSSATPKSSFRRMPAKLIVQVAAPQAPLQTQPVEYLEEPDEDAIREERRQWERAERTRRKTANVDCECWSTR